MRHNEGYHRPRGAWQPTQRQRQVLDALAEGKTNAEIAVRLGITVDGAKWHVGELLAQTDLRDRQALAGWWRNVQKRLSRGWFWIGLVLLKSAVGAVALVIVVSATAAFWIADKEKDSVVRQPVGQPSLDTAPDWSLAHFVSREEQKLTVRLDATGEVLRIDLPYLGVFDCRIDCFRSDGTLGPVSQYEELCIGWLGIRDGHQDGLLWVNRYTCEAGGRVIPP